jgi:superfamily II DNA or RNA helicase
MSSIFADPLLLSGAVTPEDLAMLQQFISPREVSLAFNLVTHGYVTISRDLDHQWQSAHVKVNGSTFLVLIERGSSGKTLSCSCPIKAKCVHTAAVFLYSLLLKNHAVSPTTAGATPVPKLPQDVQRWLSQLSDTPEANVAVIQNQYRKNVKERLLYVLAHAGHESRHLDRLKVIEARLMVKTSGFTKQRKIFNNWPHQSSGYNRYAYLHNTADGFVLATDLQIRRSLEFSNYRQQDPGGYDLHGGNLDTVLPDILRTGRAYAQDIEGREPLVAGKPRPGQFAWSTLPDGRQHLTLACTPPASLIVSTCAPWYVDLATNECGPVSTDIDPKVIALCLRAPSFDTEAASSVAQEMSKRAIGLVVPLPPNIPIEVIRVAPKPVLHIKSELVRSGRGNDKGAVMFSFADVHFGYAPDLIVRDNDVAAPRKFIDGRVVVVERDREEESRRLSELPGSLTTIDSETSAFQFMQDPSDDTSDGAFWCHLQSEILPTLRALGWETVIDQDHPYLLDTTIHSDDWQCAVAESEPGWFEIGLGIIINGKKTNLADILDALSDDPSFHRAFSDPSTAPDLPWFVPTPDGPWISVPFERLKKIYAAFAEIETIRENGGYRISRYNLNAINALDSFTSDIPDHTGTLLAYAKDLSTDTPPVFPVPPTLVPVLRSYQTVGYQWLQLHGKHGVGSVLGDDVGLGKTIQVQAHLLGEKLSGAAKAPSIIITTRSTIGKWKKEIQQFTPELSVLTLHGQDRHDDFDKIDGHDVVLTTYALLTRDLALFKARAWHCAILDEAHAIRNAKSKAALAACALNTKQRIAMTATVLQNNLADVWSALNFVAPGLLHNEKWFRTTFRIPIEQGKNDQRNALLRQMIRPFLLRRLRDEIPGLPTKTTEIHHVILEGKQRDLYEVLRASMETKIRAVIQDKGLQRARIQILQALTQLRQLCCDPRLLKIDAAKGVKSAKFEACMGLLTDLVGANNKVLLFSTFTSMLDLFKPALTENGITWAEITGSTRDREAPQEALRNGKAQVMLISLKAGGEGLDLQAANTVLFYDPWWNPQAEEQATGRAHRSGQDKPVLVIRMVVAGSVEEGILTLQEKKRNLFDALMTGSPTGIEAMSEADVEMLLAPLRDLDM